MEEKIRRQLRSRGLLKDWELKQKVNANRDGLWVYDMAKRNLERAKEIAWDNKNKKWRLVR
jgi:hypothetical protein